MNCYILDEDGKTPIEATFLEKVQWEQRLGWEGAYRVAKDEVKGGDVSTVFLGRCNHGDYWETMVQCEVLDEEFDRYPTLEAAVRGHQAMVARVRAAEVAGP